ncbi:ABC transporter permease [Sunxiuqinia sp. A32]|uniref:ABC transporter permease n=1 Tax=Sunxiuqinia sp. A32 TaxID=3461496 RepID=UPI00404672BA
MATTRNQKHQPLSGMNAANISISGILLGLLLVVPTMVLVWQLRLGFNKKLGIAVLRMLVQLGFVAVYLKYIFLLNNPFVNVAYVLVMVLIAAFSAIRTSNLAIKKLWFPTFICMLLPTLLTLLYFNWAIVQLDNIFQAELLIPVAGLMLGNTLKSNIVSLKTFFNQARKENKTYQYLLATGATRQEASRPFVKEAVRTAMAPNLATMATVGLVSLPGVMTGQILGGSDPMLAVKYQIMVMIIIFFNSLLSNLLQLYTAVHKGFNKSDQLDKGILK